MVDKQTNVSSQTPGERYFTEHVQLSSGAGANYDLLRAEVTEKLRWGWRLLSMTRGPGGDSVELVWDRGIVGSPTQLCTSR